MAEDDLRTVLSREWIHSHEEEQHGEIVFRPAHYTFPPSRGRKSMRLEPNGKLSGAIPGATDVPENIVGSWRLDGKQLTLEYRNMRLRYRIVSATPEKLVLKRLD